VRCLECTAQAARRSFAKGLAAWRFDLFAGLATTIPYFLAALLLGPEFPSLIAGLVGLIGAEGALIRRTIIAMSGHVLLTGALTLLWSAAAPPSP